MKRLTINDLNTVEELSADEAAKISGGFFASAALFGGMLITIAAQRGAFDSISVSDMLKS